MAFPDFGPLPVIGEYTQNGMAQGSFLFQLVAGEIAGSRALHYIGLLFALIGGIAIVFLQRFHTLKHILSWTFLVLILLIGPRNSSTFFTEIGASAEQGVPNNLMAYTPQAVVIDVMSKIHRAVYLGFFDISDPASPRMRNPMEDLTRAVAFGNDADLTLHERPDIQQEIQAYKTLGCGEPANLTKSLYSRDWDNKFKSYNNANPNYKFEPQMLTAQETYNLQQKLFRIKQVQPLLATYDIAYKNKQTYAPFGVLFRDEDDLRGSLEKSGVENGRINKEVIYFNNFEVDDIEGLPDLAWALTTRDSVIDHINSNPLNNVISTGVDSEDAVLSGYVTDITALNDPWNANILSLMPAVGIATWTPPVETSQDPIEQRLKHTRTTPWFSEESERSAWIDEISSNRENAVMSVGFLTAPMTTIYRHRSYQGVDGAAKRDISKLNPFPTYNIVNTCAQLHFMVRNHIKDALIYQSVWPNHDLATNLNLGTTGSTGEVAKPGALGKAGGFAGFVSSNTATDSFKRYPYDIPKLDIAANSKMHNLHARVQSIAESLGFNEVDETTDPPVATFVTPLNDGAHKETAIEIVRRLVMKNIMDVAFTQTQMPLVKIAPTAAQANAPMTELDQAMRGSFSGDSIKNNIPNITSGWLQDAVAFVSEVAGNVGAQFAGLGAVAFIRFLQLFIAIGLFFVLMCTPILYMMGLLVPAHAPGVILTSVVAVVALKAVPIGFTLVDAVMSNAMRSYDSLNFTDIDQSMMVYVAAAAYTSITMITFFLLFKAGDTEAVLSQITKMDQKANEIAETGVSALKTLAALVTTGAAAGVGGSIGAISQGVQKGKGAGQIAKESLLAGGSQAFEVYGKQGLSAIPGVGDAFQQVTTSYREGSGQAAVLDEIQAENELRRERGEKEMSWGDYQRTAAQSAAEGKYRAIKSSAESYAAEGSAEEGFKKAAASQGMTTTEARRLAREMQAEGANNSVLSSAVAQQKISMDDAQVTIAKAQVDADAYGGNVMDGSLTEISPKAMQAIAQGLGGANMAMSQGSTKRVAELEKKAILGEIANETETILKNDVAGPGRKPMSSITYYTYDDEGKVSSTKATPQDAMFDQGASKLKKQLKSSGAFKDVSEGTLKEVTENIAAKELAAQAKGSYADGSNFELKLDASVVNTLKKNNAEDRISSTSAGDLWIKPGSGLYKELAELKENGKYVFGDSETGVRENENISLFNMHMANNSNAYRQAEKNLTEAQKKLDEVNASLGLKKSAQQNKRNG